MRTKRWFVIFLCFNTLFFSFSQEQFPDYHPPLKIPLIVAGNFGELRSSHFHTGVDFKTQQREGHTIYAIERGYVSRVKVSPYGYGKVVYVDHPNGKTSVYAHCSKFLGQLEQRVFAEQIRLQQFEIELFFATDDLIVKKGEPIALSGNTGGSSAPHLHFEIRDTKTEHAQNPLVYAFDLPDSKSPLLKNIKIVAVNNEGYLIPNKTLEFPISTANNKFFTNDTVKIPPSFCSASGGIGIAVDMIDFLDGASNKCGVYGTWLIADGDTLFGHQQDEISFDHMRYVHSHRIGTKGNFHKLFRNENNPLSFYRTDQLGVVNIAPGQTKNLHLVAYDLKGNTSIVSFVLKAQNGTPAADYQPSMETFWYPQYGYVRKNSKWELIADSCSIFEPILLNTKKTPHLCEIGTPLNKTATIRIKLENPQLPTEKYYIAVETIQGKRPLATKYNEGWLEATTNSAGEFFVQTDRLPPQIKLLPRAKNSRRIRLKITDHQSGIATYKLFVDKQWHLLEYEYKGSYVFFDSLPEWKGTKEVKVIVIDRCGNETTWQQTMSF